MQFNKLIPIILLAYTLQGCVGAAAVAVVTGASMATDERTFGKQIDDQGIEFKASSELSENEALNNQTNIHVVSINGSVLMVGQAPNNDLRSLAVAKVSKIEGVLQVHNQIRISNTISFTTRSNDTWLTSKVKTALFSSDTLDATNIKVITENGEVFLMGLVSEANANEAVKIARNISGVNRVFKAFEYL